MTFLLEGQPLVEGGFAAEDVAAALDAHNGDGKGAEAMLGSQKQLQAMGFPATRARAALLEVGGDVGKAVALLTAAAS